MKRLPGVFMLTLMFLLSALSQRQKSVEIDNSLVKLSFDKGTMTWSFLQTVSGDWTEIVHNASLELTLKSSDSPVVAPEGTDVTAKSDNYSDPLGNGKRLDVQIRGPKALWTLSFILYDGKSALSLQATVKNLTRGSWSTKELRLFKARDAAHIQLVSEPVIAHLNGYQSWSHSDDVQLDSARRQTSYWAALFYEPAAYRSILLGFVTNSFSTNRFEIEPLSGHDGEMQIVAVSDIRTLEVAAGKEMKSDRLLISIDSSPHDNLAHYGEDLELLAPRINKPFTPTGKENVATLDKREVPAGWCSWYYYYDRISEDSIMQNLNFAAKHLRSAGLKYIQIDDGYQIAAGEWDVNGKFPNGHRWMVEQIHSKKFLAGLWLAPFAVAEKSKVFKEHPDWILRDANDTMKVFFTNDAWGGKIYGLDPTIHEVQVWLENLFYTAESYWGYDYVKIDFLHFANEGGKYHIPMTSTQAYQLGLAAIRRGVGSDKFILGCGAPIGSSIGYVDGMRIGPDVYAGWDGVTPGVNAAARRYFLHNNVWYDDPDCLVVRDPLTMDQARVWASVVALSGQMNLLSDKLNALPPERVELLKKTLPVYGKSAKPVDLFAAPSQRGIEISDASGEHSLKIPDQWKISTGDDSARRGESYDDGDWKEIPVPSHWEEEGFPGYDGFVWYRVKFTMPADRQGVPLRLSLGKIDDCDEAFVNGARIGGTGTFPPSYSTEWSTVRKYAIPGEIVHWGGENTLAVRVYDGGGPGGIYDATEARLPEVWNLLVEKPFEKWNVVGMFNWSDDKRNMSATTAQLNLAPKKSYLLYEAWTNTFLGELNRQVSVSLRPTSSAIISIHEKKPYPVILSTSRHIAQGAVDLVDETWDEGKKTLTVVCDNLIGGEYAVALYIPDGFGPPKISAPCGMEIAKDGANLYRIKLFPPTQKLTWKAIF